MVLICFNGAYDGETYLQLPSNKNRSQCPHSWSCFANIDCLGSASLIFWSFNLPVWNSPWISWCCFMIFATLGVRQISQVSVAKDLPPSWSGLLLKDALCKLNQVGINICPKTMLKVTVWRHMISSWFWNRCCCELGVGMENWCLKPQVSLQGVQDNPLRPPNDDQPVSTPQLNPDILANLDSWLIIQKTASCPSD